MTKLIKKYVILILVIAMSLSIIPTKSYTYSDCFESITKLVEKAEKEASINGEASDETINALEKELNYLGIDVGSYSGTHILDEEDDDFVFYGYGETHSLGNGWTYRVDKPSSSNAKPHVHVDNNKRGIHGTENVDGTPSHGKTLERSGVPKKVREKVRGSKDYKKGQNDLKNMKRAKAEIKRWKLNLNKYKYLIIAAGIFVAIVGVAFFAPEALPAVLPAI